MFDTIDGLVHDQGKRVQRIVRKYRVENKYSSSVKVIELQQQETLSPLIELQLIVALHNKENSINEWRRQIAYIIVSTW